MNKIFKNFLVSISLVLLHQVSFAQNFEDNEVVIPYVTMQELDAKKEDKTEYKNKSIAASKIIEKIIEKNKKRRKRDAVFYIIS